ncbi:hypothetical protein FMUBM48_26520 [Nocardia cyriacigeorgica]|nr:hypothetical protein FMUBM48_26520 [Nocardia cyriacigeorgica]
MGYTSPVRQDSVICVMAGPLLGDRPYYRYAAVPVAAASPETDETALAGDPAADGVHDDHLGMPRHQIADRALELVDRR